MTTPLEVFFVLKHNQGHRLFDSTMQMILRACNPARGLPSYERLPTLKELKRMGDQLDAVMTCETTASATRP